MTIFLHTNFRAVGGIENATSALAIQLVSKGLKIVFVSRDSEPCQMDIPAEVSEYRLLAKRTASWSDTRSMARHLQIWRLPLVVFIKMLHMFSSAYKLRQIYMATGEPKIVVQHQQVMTIALLAGIPRKKIVLVLHRNYQAYESSKMLFYFIKFCIRTSGTTITLSEVDRQKWERINIVTEFIPNIHSSTITEIPPKQKLVVWVGRMVQIKNICDVIAAFDIATKNFPDWTLSLVGDGPERSVAEQYSKRLGISERVIFHGYANPEEFYLRATFLLLASTTEGYSLVLDEAISFGVIPVVRPFGENTSERVPKKYGVISNGPLAKDLADSLFHLINSPDEVRKYQSNLRALVNNADTVCNAWLRVLIS